MYSWCLYTIYNEDLVVSEAGYRQEKNILKCLYKMPAEDTSSAKSCPSLQMHPLSVQCSGDSERGSNKCAICSGLPLSF